ncbi:nitroreductase family protein [Paenibacillus sp. CC-CFT747]|nr:nitroreductase family protein [Paenibacillus sp. CC-CFT747]
MSTSVPQDLQTALRERRSVKQYDPGYQMSKEELKELLKLTGRAPSSWNLQHWKFLVVHSDEQKQKLLPIAYGQQQIVQSSAVIAVLGDLEANLNAEPIYSEGVKAGALPQEVKDALIGQINAAYQSPQVARDEAIRNASLASMQLMLAAKTMGLDTCPMGGFDQKKFVEAFEVPERYIPVMLISVGKAAQPGRPSGRFP